MHCDVVDEDSFILDFEDDYPYNGRPLLDDGYMSVSDDFRVVLLHRARGESDALDIVFIGRID